MKKIARSIVRRALWCICWFLPLNKKKIVFSSYYGRGYGDNPKYIAQALLRSERKYKLIWFVKNEEEAHMLPLGIKAVKLGSFSSIYHLTTAKIWVDNCRKSFPYKKKGQVYIQTWHGFALKRIEKDVEDNLSPAYVENAKKDAKNIDLIISDSKHMTEIYNRAFWYDGEVVEWGSPRNDIIINTDNQRQSYQTITHEYGLANASKIVLYAPTFRSSGSLDVYSIDLEKVRVALEEKFNNSFVVLVRLHPNIAHKSNQLPFKWSSTIIDVSQYPDLQVLLSAADVVISDYSSLMFDFALSNKPCFQFATDIDEYKNDRNFYFELDGLPFSLSTNNDEMISCIKDFDSEAYHRKLLSFYEKVGMNKSGDSSSKCVQYINEISK